MSVVQLAEQRALTGGFYTVQEAARILQIEQSGKITRWISQDDEIAVIQSQYQTNSELGFFDLMEVRFIDYFRRQGVSLQSIRKAAEQARKDYELTHPFAMSNANLVTDRKTIFLHVAQETRDDILLDMVSGQHAFYDVIEDYLAKGVSFSASGLANEWKPEPKIFPDVSLNPLMAHGLPTLGESGVPTGSLFSLWRAESQDTNKVADWYEISSDLVKQAIEYELKLAA